MAQELASLKQPSPNNRIQHCGSGAPEGDVKWTINVSMAPKLSTKKLIPNPFTFYWTAV